MFWINSLFHFKYISVRWVSVCVGVRFGCNFAVLAHWLVFYNLFAELFGRLKCVAVIIYMVRFQFIPLSLISPLVLIITFILTFMYTAQYPKIQKPTSLHIKMNTQLHKQFNNTNSSSITLLLSTSTID